MAQAIKRPGEAVTPPTLAHGDTHAGNILISEKDRRLYLIDWGKASSSRLGYDLVKVAAPWTHIGRGGKFAEYTELESFLLSEYLMGSALFCRKWSALSLKGTITFAVCRSCSYPAPYHQALSIGTVKKHRLKLEKNRKELARFLISQGEQALSILDRTALSLRQLELDAAVAVVGVEGVAWVERLVLPKAGCDQTVGRDAFVQQ